MLTTKSLVCRVLFLRTRLVFAFLSVLAATACSGEVQQSPDVLAPCLDTQSDPYNCGACGVQCASTDVCQAGACVAVCGEAQAWCAGSCVSPASDLNHCGGCDNSCGDGLCVNGQCAQSCPLTTCPGAAGEQCVDPLTDAAHCGACGNACSVDQVCVAGACQLDCAPGLAACTDSCADLAGDAQNCGACGAICGDNAVCTGGACGCATGFSECADGCVDFTSDAANCGACGTACGDSFVCLAGACGCADGTDLCGDSCADFSSDAANCGACGNQCGDSFTCQQGACACAEGQTDCDGECSDLLVADLNCGACGVECLGGSTCNQGTCDCPNGQTLCGDTCVDVSESTDHCGACGNACDAADACQAGVCTGADGCVSIPVADLDVTQLAVYQTMKIPLLNAGGNQRLNVEDDATPLVEGKEAFFRVFVNPKADYRQRELSARLTFRAEGAEEPQFFFDKKEITGQSEETSGNNSFQIPVPADVIKPDSEYSLSVVSCENAAPVEPAAQEPAGQEPQNQEAPPEVNVEDLTTRFPVEGFQSLRTIETGPIKIHMFPVNDGSGAPDINEELLGNWRARLLAIFPNPSVEFTIRDTVNTGQTGMCEQVGVLRSLRSQENPDTEIYYYGVTDGPSGNTAGCSGRSTSARQALARVSAGLARDGNGFERGASTFVHELGHAAGRAHVDCGNPASPDPNYPYDGGDTGTWGFDIRTTTLKPPTSKDMMSYCPRGNRPAAWISDYTYEALMQRQGTLFQFSQQDFADALDTVEPVAWRLLMATSSQPSWIDGPLMVRGTPDGEPRSAIVLDAFGAAIATVTVYAEELHDGSDVHKHMFTVPTGQPEWHTLQVPGLPPVEL